MKMSAIKGIGLATILGSGLAGCSANWSKWTPDSNLKSAATDLGLNADSLERSVNEYCERSGNLYYENNCKYTLWRDATNSDSALIERARKKIQKQNQERINASPSLYNQGVADGKKAVLDSISKAKTSNADSSLQKLVLKIVKQTLDTAKIIR